MKYFQFVQKFWSDLFNTAILWKTASTWLSLSGVIVVLDQWSKRWVMSHVALHIPFPVVPHIRFLVLFNEGTAFSWLSEGNFWEKNLLMMLSSAISVGLLWQLGTVAQNRYWYRTAVALLLGGAIGNLIDRFTLGYVIDFIDFFMGNWHWYVFNIADAAITLGAGCFIVDWVKQKK